jgi:uncharacterized delta-60 repeat protein
MLRIFASLRTIFVLMTGASLLSCGSSSGTTALAKAGISTVVITTIDANTNARAKAVAIQSDGNIVAAGYSYDGAKNVFALARYINDGVMDGTLDAGFGTGGIVTTPIGTVNAEAQALVVQASDQKLVVAGFSYDGAQNVFSLVRYNTDGSLDTAGFGSGTGIVTTSVGSLDDRAFAVAIQSDGKIIVAGYSSEVSGNGIQSRLAVVRYNTDGTLDDTFDSDGMAIFDSSTYVSSSDPTAKIFSAGASALAIQADDKLVAAGFAYMNLTDGNKMRQQDEFLLVRYNPDGSPDSTLNGGDETNTSGAVTTLIDKVNDDAYALAVDGDKLIAAGSSYTTRGRFAVVRYNSDGTLDTTFNNTGKVTTDVDSNAGASAVAVETDEKVVVAGRGYNNTYAKFALVRYNTDGRPDGTFGSSGKVSTAITYGAEAFGLVIQSDGKPVAAGYSRAQQEPEKFTLVRYLTDGKVDTTFPLQP